MQIFVFKPTSRNIAGIALHLDRALQAPNFDMRISREGELLPTVSVIESPAESYATWSSASERGTGGQASIPPFTRNHKNQVHDPLSIQLSNGSEIELDVETQPAYSNKTQPRTPISLSQLPEEHMAYSQEIYSYTLDKNGEQGNMEKYYFLQTLEGHSDYVISMAFSPDGKLLASGSSDNTIKLWDTHSEASLKTIKRHNDTVGTLAFSSDNKQLASGSMNSFMNIWKIHSEASQQTLKRHRLLVSTVAFYQTVSCRHLIQ